MKKTLLCLVVGVFLVGLISEQATAQDWWNRAWNYRKKITINNAQVPGTVTNFPVLLSIASDSDLAALAKPDGSDLVIATAAGTQCPREINTWSDATGQLQMWFKAPLVNGDTDTDFYLYYGNPSGNESDSTDTWDENFVAVWHFETAPVSGGGADCLDSTSNGNDVYADTGMNAGNLIVGQIGNAWHFQGASTDRAYAYDSDSLDITNLTVSAWLYSTDPDNEITSGPIHKQDGAAPEWIIYGYIGRNWRLYLYGVPGAGSQYKYLWKSSTAIPYLTWYCFGLTVNHAGSLTGVGWKNTSSYAQTWDAGYTVPVTTDRIYLADDGSKGYTSPYMGYMDEMQVSNVKRPNNWMKTCYYNWSDPGAFHTLAEEEELPAAGTIFIVR